jgi:hypothetical protein
MEEGETEAGEVLVGQKRHAPIVWKTPPKVPRTSKDPLLDSEEGIDVEDDRGEAAPQASGRLQTPPSARQPSPLFPKKGARLTVFCIPYSCTTICLCLHTR